MVIYYRYHIFIILLFVRIFKFCLVLKALYLSETSNKGRSEGGQTTQEWTSQKYSCLHAPYNYRKSPSSERGQPLYKGQNGWSRRYTVIYY